MSCRGEKGLFGRNVKCRRIPEGSARYASIAIAKAVSDCSAYGGH
jgi:hypothetical protein